MLSCARFIAAALFALLALGNVAADKKKPAPAATGTPTKTDKLSVPVPVGHEAKELVIPYYNGEGRMEMNFKMQLAKRIDADHLQMGDLKIEMFDEKGESAM